MVTAIRQCPSTVSLRDMIKCSLSKRGEGVFKTCVGNKLSFRFHSHTAPNISRCTFTFSVERCDARTELQMSDGNDVRWLYYAREESDCLQRTLCPVCHPFKIYASVGDRAGGAVFAIYERDSSCCSCSKCMSHVHGLKCCCFQEMLMRDAKGLYIGSIRERTFCCNPRFTVYDTEDIPEYDIRPPGCCFGLCTDCCCETYGEETPTVW